MPGFKQFSIINAEIIKKVLSEYSHYNIKIKKPNDILIKNQKVCGILQELIKFEKKIFLIIGIGINTVNSPKTNSFNSISLVESSNKYINNFEILMNLKKNYENIFYNYKFNKIFLKK